MFQLSGVHYRVFRPFSFRAWAFWLCTVGSINCFQGRRLETLNPKPIRLMDKILHDLKDPKLWELWYIPYYGSCRILSINRRTGFKLHDVLVHAQRSAGST